MTHPTGPAHPAPHAPYRAGPFPIRPDWIDANGHLNLAYTVLLFDAATDATWATIDPAGALRGADHTIFVVETHTIYLAELLLHDTVMVATHILAADAKRLHLAHEMTRLADGAVAARQELMIVCVSLDTRRAAPWPALIANSLAEAALAARHAAAPDWAGRRIVMPSRSAPAPAASTAPGPG